MHKLAFLPCCIAALVAFSAGGCERISSRRVEAIATDAKNARRNGAGTLLAGEHIASGASIETGAGGRADLMLLPNTLLRLEENGEVQISGLKLTVDGNETSGGIRERAAAVRLPRGRVVARLEQHGYNTASLIFHTGRAQIRADGNALFEITEQPDATSAICLRGHVDVAPAAAHHVSTLWPGETMRMDKAGSHHLELPAPELSSAQARCAQAETALQYEATAQMETRR